jgi:hypothetical protein
LSNATMQKGTKKARPKKDRAYSVWKNAKKNP